MKLNYMKSAVVLALRGQVSSCHCVIHIEMILFEFLDFFYVCI